MRHLDQASPTPLGTDERTRLSLTKTSMTLGSGPHQREGERTQKRGPGARRECEAATVEAQAQNTLAALTGTKPLTAKPTDRDITGKLPSQVSVNVGTHGAKRSPTMRGKGMVREGGREAGDSKTDHRDQGEEEGNGCGPEQDGRGKTDDGKQHRTGGQSEHGEDEKKDGEQEETGKHKT